MQTGLVPIITIDGPSGSGKGTLSTLLARKLNWHYLDSGALYRALALKCARENLNDTSDKQSLSDIARQMKVTFKPRAHHSALVYLESEDVSDLIRTEVCGGLASKISAIAEVREVLLAQQRAFCELPGLVADGRDMGTVVFPQAAHKFYLEAEVSSRAERRFWELKQKGLDVTLQHLLDEVQTRDARDRMRTLSPLMPAPDAIIIDSTGLSIEAVLSSVLEHLKI